MHLLSAFALVGSLTLYTIATVAARRVESPEQTLALTRVVAAGTVALGVGFVGTAVFGIWLVFIVNGYSILNGWIFAALVLWLIVGALGDRSVVEYRKATTLARDLGSQGEEGRSAELTRALRSRAVLGLRVGAAAAAVAILALMIWKPGA